MKIILSIVLTLGLATKCPAPHEFEDGFVERTFAVVIRDDLATAKYSIGLNESTLRDLLDHWKKPEVAKPTGTDEELSHKTLGPAQTNVQSKGLIGSEVSQNQNTDLQQPEANQFDAQAKTEPEKPAAAPAAPTDAAPTDGSGSEASSDVAETPSANASGESPEAQSSEHLDKPIPEELLASLRKLGPAQIARQITVSCNGKPLQIKNVSAAAAPRHPFNLVVQFEFEIPSLESAKLKIEDQNFRQHSGAIRYALKVLGSTILVKSDVAPLIVRAQRHELAGLSKKEAAIRTSIAAEVLLPSKLKIDK